MPTFFNMWVLILIIVAIGGIVVYRKRKSVGDVSKSQPSKKRSAVVAPADHDATGNKIYSQPLYLSSLSTLRSTVTPNKHGEFNDSKKVGKTLAKINEEVQKVYPKGTAEYVAFFMTLYGQTVDYMLASQDGMLAEATRYTLQQKEEWDNTGKCQTFVKGLSDDELVAFAEVIMTTAEKCWFGNVKTTMWRKDMEKYDLPCMG